MRATFHPSAALVGRQRELAALDQALAAARGGEAACRLVVGEPTIGKSRLLAEVASRADVAGDLVFAGRGSKRAAVAGVVAASETSS